MKGFCVSKRPLRFWQYQPTAEAIPMWVALHSNVNEGGKNLRENVKITVTCSGEEWTLDPGDFVIDRPGAAPYVVSESEFHDMFDICPEQARG